MKRNSRIFVLIMCLIIVIVSGVMLTLGYRLDILSFILGLAVGWALRETTEPIQEGDN